jgi:APA family basic amino acid/polyamine antiporter
MSFKKYFRCRSIESLLTEADKSHDLKRTFGALQLILLGMGAIIGAGIFAYTGTGAGEHAGPAVVLSFILAGLACACAALCYAELASAIPIAGSSYTYSYAALGELPAWFIAGMIVLTYGLGASAVASSWSAYLQSFLADFNIHIPAVLSACSGKVVTLSDGSTVTALFDLPAVFIVFLLATIVYRGAEGSASFNTFIVIVKMVALSLFVIIGAGHINPANWTPFIPENTGTFGEFGLSGIVAGSAVIFLAYSGFDAVATAAQETKNPKRDLPIGIIGSLLISAFVYVLVSGVLTGLASYKELNVGDPVAVAVNKIGMPWFASTIKIGAIFGLTSVILVLMFGLVRVFYTITHDGLLPEGLAKTHKKYKTPHRLTTIIALVIAFLGGVVPTNGLVKLANLGTLMTFTIVCIGTIYLRYKRPDMKREFLCPLMPWVPLLGAALFGSIIFGLPSTIYYYAAIWIAIWISIYFLYGRHNSHLQHPHKKKKFIKH